MTREPKPTIKLNKLEGRVRCVINGINYMEYIYAKRKNKCTSGTFESSAFILSLKDEDEFSTLHSFGFHRVPLIGMVH